MSNSPELDLAKSDALAHMDPEQEQEQEQEQDSSAYLNVALNGRESVNAYRASAAWEGHARVARRQYGEDMRRVRASKGFTDYMAERAAARAEVLSR